MKRIVCTLLGAATLAALVATYTQARPPTELVGAAARTMAAADSQVRADRPPTSRNAKTHVSCYTVTVDKKGHKTLSKPSISSYDTFAAAKAAVNRMNATITQHADGSGWYYVAKIIQQ